MKKNNKGFTLIEVLVVIGIIAILAGIVLVAVNPARQFAQARDTQRTSDITAILNAIGQYAADNKGAMVPGVTSSSTIIGNGVGQLNICPILIPTYISSLPRDPSIGGPVTDCTITHSTGYSVSQDATSTRITVSADAEVGTSTISITR